MTTEKEVEELLDLYLRKVLPAMLRRQYHLHLVKGGADYPHLSEQSHLTHIINGVMGLCRLVLFLIAIEFNEFNISIDILKKVLALFTIHEVHKDKDVEKLGSSEFSVPLKRLEEEYAEEVVSRGDAEDAEEAISRGDAEDAEEAISRGDAEAQRE